MDIDWLIESAHEHDASVYPLLHAMYRDDSYATADMMRAAFANYRARGVDGLYSWALKWPPGDEQHAILSEQSDPSAAADDKKHYFVISQFERSREVVSYESALPLNIASNDTDRRYGLPLYIADDLENEPECTVQMRLFIVGLVDADQFTVYLNNESVMDEESGRYFHDVQIWRPVDGSSSLCRKFGLS